MEDKKIRRRRIRARLVDWAVLAAKALLQMAVTAGFTVALALVSTVMLHGARSVSAFQAVPHCPAGTVSTTCVLSTQATVDHTDVSKDSDSETTWITLTGPGLTNGWDEVNIDGDHAKRIPRGTVLPVDDWRGKVMRFTVLGSVRRSDANPDLQADLPRFTMAALFPFLIIAARITQWCLPSHFYRDDRVLDGILLSVDACMTASWVALIVLAVMKLDLALARAGFVLAGVVALTGLAEVYRIPYVAWRNGRRRAARDLARQDLAAEPPAAGVTDRIPDGYESPAARVTDKIPDGYEPH